VGTEWDYTAGGPGTMVKLESGDAATYIGGLDRSFGDDEKMYMLSQVIRDSILKF
jgi:hypothetical protein